MHSPGTTMASFALLIAAVGGAFVYVAGSPVDIEILKEPWFGFRGSPLTPALAEASNLQGEQGFLVMVVEDGSPAAIAGLKGGERTAVVDNEEVILGGDLITEINGERVTGIEEIQNVLDASRVGDAVELAVLRGGQTVRMTVTLGENPG